MHFLNNTINRPTLSRRVHLTNIAFLSFYLVSNIFFLIISYSVIHVVPYSALTDSSSPLI